MTQPLLTAAACRHIARLCRAVAPFATRLDRAFAKLLRDRPYDRPQIATLLSITPAAASRLRSVHSFLEQVEHNGRRLANLNLPPGEVFELVRAFDPLLDSVLQRQFEPAREQLQLATVFTLNQAFYNVREAETQAFFGLYRAEALAADLQDLLRRFIGILMNVFQARSGRLFAAELTAAKPQRPLYIRHGQRRETLIGHPEMRGRAVSYWSLPLRGGGLVQLGFGTARPWLPREFALLEALGERCSKAIERTRMEQDLGRLRAEALRAEEDERRRIGLELHDETGQTLVWLRLRLEMLERDAPDQLCGRIREARMVTEKAIIELRRIMAALSPTVLDRLGLGSALRQLAARFRKMHAARLRIRIATPAEPLPRAVQQVIYRVAQESLQNIIKHSQASAVNLSLQAADQNIRLSVSDNGRGFRGETAARGASFGLAGMRERAALLGGSLEVKSAPGDGCKVRLQLPRAARLVQANGKNSSPSNGRSHIIPAGHP